MLLQSNAEDTVFSVIVPEMAARKTPLFSDDESFCWRCFLGDDIEYIFAPYDNFNTNMFQLTANMGIFFLSNS